MYLGKRDFIDHLEEVDPIDGVIVVENEYLKGRKVFGQVRTVHSYSIGLLKPRLPDPLVRFWT